VMVLEGQGCTRDKAKLSAKRAVDVASSHLLYAQLRVICSFPFLRFGGSKVGMSTPSHAYASSHQAIPLTLSRLVLYFVRSDGWSSTFILCCLHERICDFFAAVEGGDEDEEGSAGD
jgi:hypothetical protein